LHLVYFNVQLHLTMLQTIRLTGYIRLSGNRLLFYQAIRLTDKGTRVRVRGPIVSVGPINYVYCQWTILFLGYFR